MDTRVATRKLSVTRRYVVSGDRGVDVSTADAARAPRVGEHWYDVKEEKRSFNDSCEEGCVIRNADIQQVMSLIINTKDVKGPDKAPKEQKDHRQRQARVAPPTAG